jgi:L(+)-tartrate dehydratase alpha subunit
MTVPVGLIEEIAVELNRRAAVAVPLDARQSFQRAADRETNPLAKQVLLAIVDNCACATADGRPMCGDTGVPRYYVKVGNEAGVEGGFVAFEQALRRGLAKATQEVKLRSNRVHPLTRRNPGNNVGVFAPNIDYRFEPGGDWIDITAVHKGGLFGSDYRMLFPGDGIPGIKRFLLDTIASFNRRGLSCPPLIVGVGIGGTKDQSFSLGKEAACLRLVGDRHPDPVVAELELELLDLANQTLMGVMGLRSDTPVLDVHCEVAYTHTGGTPVGITELCHAVRRSTVRIHGDGSFEFREDPRWFTEYSRREGVDWSAGEPSAVPAPAAPPIAVAEPAAVASTSPAAPETRTFHLNVPLSEADVRQLRIGDIVYLSGPIFTARDGVYEYMLGEGHEPPIDIKNAHNVTFQSSPAGTEVSPGHFEVASLQATAGFRYAKWMEALLSRYGVRAVVCKGGMSEEVYRTVFQKHGAVCLSTLGYGIGALYGRGVKQVRNVYWKDQLGISEAMWVLELDNLGPLLVEGDTEGRSFFAQHSGEVDEPLMRAYGDLPRPILSRMGEVLERTEELIKEA